MTPFPRLATFACATLFLVFGALALAGSLDEKDKEKPKDAATIDDAKATLTETVDGKEKTTKLDLKYALKVKGYFAKDGLHIEEVEAGGPAASLSGGSAMLEKGDIIAEIDGKKIKSAQDYVKAMNGAEDHTQTKLKVKDVRTGDEADFTADAVKL
jgi:C-terminal processing protease CtpA/Prc